MIKKCSFNPIRLNLTKVEVFLQHVYLHFSIYLRTRCQRRALLGKPPNFVGAASMVRWRHTGNKSFDCYCDLYYYYHYHYCCQTFVLMSIDSFCGNVDTNFWVRFVFFFRESWLVNVPLLFPKSIHFRISMRCGQKCPAFWWFSLNRFQYKVRPLRSM